jgi:hypothetical protein
MTPAIISIFSSTSVIHTFVKTGIIILLLMHVAFAVILLRQTRLMSKVIVTSASVFLFTISLIHFLASIFVVIWTIIYL